MTPLLKSLVPVFSGIEEASGGRPKMVELLDRLDLAPNELILLKMLADPSRARKPLAQLCRQAAVSVSRLLQLLSQARNVRAMMEAQDRISERLPDLASDIMTRALVAEETCLVCDGAGVIPGDDPQECRRCAGKGALAVAPERDRQELAARVSGLLKPSGGNKTQVNVLQQNNQIAAPLTTSAQFRSAVDRVLYPRKYDVVDAEPAEKK